MWLVWIVVALLTCGLILLIIPLMTNTNAFSRTEEFAICQNCAFFWDVTPAHSVG